MLSDPKHTASNLIPDTSSISYRIRDTSMPSYPRHEHPILSATRASYLIHDTSTSYLIRDTRTLSCRETVADLVWPLRPGATLFVALSGPAAP
eukprot:2437146-Rhodomonas_salina.1